MENYLVFLRHRFESISNEELIKSLKFEFVWKSITKDIALDEAKKRGINIDRINILDVYNDLCNEQKELFSKFEEVSIRGRVAFGISCIEKLTTQYKLINPQITEFLELFWSYVSSSSLDRWEATIMDLMPNEDEYWLFSEKFAFKHLSDYKQFLLSVAIMNVIDIARGNLYAGYRSSDTMMYLLRLIDNMKNNSIDLPDTSPFLKSKADEVHGWGNKVQPSFFRL